MYYVFYIFVTFFMVFRKDNIFRSFVERFPRSSIFLFSFPLSLSLSHFIPLFPRHRSNFFFFWWLYTSLFMSLWLLPSLKLSIIISLFGFFFLITFFALKSFHLSQAHFFFFSGGGKGKWRTKRRRSGGK